MPKAAFYAVKRGREPGIYTTWTECEAQTKGFSNPSFKKFNTLKEAEAFISPNDLTKSNSLSAARAPAVTNMSKPKTSSSSTPAVVKNEGDWVVVYTDGACHGNGREGSTAGIGVWWGPNDSRNLSERCPGDQTNNRAELIAIIRCLETEFDPTEPLMIKTDSRYSIQCVRDWLPGWIARGWKTAGGQPVKNKAVIEYLAALLDKRPGKVRLEHVYGHRGETGNEAADQLAGEGARKPPQEERDWTAKLRGSISHRHIKETVEFDESVFDDDFDGITPTALEEACKLYDS